MDACSYSCNMMPRCRAFGSMSIFWMDGWAEDVLMISCVCILIELHMEISSIIMVQWKMAICKFCNYYWRDLFFTWN